MNPRARGKADAASPSVPEGTPDLPRAVAPERLPVVALVGRPNTGKSTLFNRLTGAPRAVTASTPGVTRDRNIAPASWGRHRLLVVDTGGFEEAEREEIGRAIRAQSLIAAEEADAIIVVVDGRAGLSPLDATLLERVRRLRKPVVLAVNKIDVPTVEPLLADFYALGVAAIYPVSAEHGRNVQELMDHVVASLPVTEAAGAAAEPATAVAIVGRPNVGKSSLLNRLVGYERAIVTAVPGTTRDPIDTRITRNGHGYVLVDTAGIRRRPRVSEHVERASVVRALRALEQAQVGVVLIDAVEGMTEQDARITTYAWDRGRGLVLLVNKWDAVPARERDQARVARAIDEAYPSLAVVPKLFISAHTGAGVERIWSAVDRVAAHHCQHLQTAKLNQVILRAAAQQAPPMVKGKRPRFFYATQTATAPPTVTVFTSTPEHVHPAYERYLANQIRALFPLAGTPLRLRFRARERAPRRRVHQTGRRGSRA